MAQAPDLFDRSALERQRVRTVQPCVVPTDTSPQASAFFLHEMAAQMVSERLQDINRTFTKLVLVGWQAELWAEALGGNVRCIADSNTLDLEPNEADLIVHCLSMHWANDPVGQLIQMRRALRPDGLMLAVMFAGETLHELRHAMTAAEAQVSGGLRPRVAPMADVRGLGALLQRAGFALPVADIERLNVSYANPRDLMREIRQMGETNVMSERAKTFSTRALFEAVDAAYPRGEDGRIRATFELAFLAGWAPAENQQKPLRPGSAKSRLADALGVPELDPEAKRS